MPLTTKRLLTGAAASAGGLAALLLAGVALRARLADPPAAQRAQADAPSDAAAAAGDQALRAAVGRQYTRVSEDGCAGWCLEHGGVTGYVDYFPFRTWPGQWQDDYADRCASHHVAVAMAKSNPEAGAGICCCATAPGGSAEPAPALPTPLSCDEWCGAGGRGRGVVLGTAPFCKPTCHEDCHGGLPHGGACSEANNDAHGRNRYGLRDFGDECENALPKLCCCARHRPEGTPAVHGGRLTCERFCRSAGRRGQSFISGTAPACEGECFPHATQCVVANGHFADLGEPCLSGSKICNCYG